MKRPLFICLVSGFWLLVSPSHAIIDTNTNGVSDLWEQQHNNGNLFPNFDPQADPDSDGWTNEQEATTGTDPNDANPPNGFIRPETQHVPAFWGDEDGQPVILTPEVITVTWLTIPGKKYTLECSFDLTAGSWMPIGAPFIANVTVPTYGFPTATAEKCFWRVAVTDADTDNDGLTNYEENQIGSSPYSADGDYDGFSDSDEFFIYHTNLNSADSDNDGVSDGDEILVNFTNPLSATDADGDGIPDDFEKHFAKLLLAYQPEAAYWGVYHEGLLAGNLDATHDYTGEGMSVGELAEILKKIPAAGPADSGYLVEQQGRRNSLQWAYYYPPPSSSSSQGTYLYSVPNDYDAHESMTPTADLSSQYLLSRIDGVAWGHSWITSGDRMSFSNDRWNLPFDALLLLSCHRMAPNSKESSVRKDVG